MKNLESFGCWISSLGEPAELGFAWDGGKKLGFGSPSFPLRYDDCPVQHFRSAILDAWRFQVFARLSERQGFLGGEFADVHGSLQVLTSSHLRERDKMLLRAILCGGVWNGFLLGKAKKENVPCRFCGKRDGDGHLFRECTFSPPPYSMFRDLPEFACLTVSGPLQLASLFALAWLVAWSWRHSVTSFVDLASFHLERCLGAYPCGLWCLLDSS